MNTINEPAYQRMIARPVSARKDAGFTQAQAVSALGWRRTMLCQIETNQRRADILEVYALANLYGITLASLEQILAGTAR